MFCMWFASRPLELGRTRTAADLESPRDLSSHVVVNAENHGPAGGAMRRGRERRRGCVGFDRLDLLAWRELERRGFSKAGYLRVLTLCTSRLARWEPNLATSRDAEHRVGTARLH
jgi:hypothetical protein